MKGKKSSGKKIFSCEKWNRIPTKDKQNFNSHK